MSEVTILEAPASTLTPRQSFRLEPLILMAPSNPKKPGSMSYDRFKGYFTLAGDVTVQDAINAGLRMDDIRHDTEHGFILVGEVAEAEATRRELERKAAEALELAESKRIARAAKRASKKG